jgi:ribosomal protein S18 acetylase RimI-like enzyme
MTSEDKPALMNILQNTPEFTRAEVLLAEEVVDASLLNPSRSGYFSLVAVEGSFFAGFVCYGPTPITESTWDVYWLAVEHHSQGRGIGRILMEAVEEKIKQAGGRLVLLETSSKPGYEKTNLFYHRMGYKEIGRIIDFYAVGDDRITYEKRFNA